MLWFGIAGAVLLVSRVAEIQYVAMRIWWFVWAAALLFFAFVQYKQFRARHYEILPRGLKLDPRDQYLPGRSK
jgi:tellurite resistance protein TehA-like permease